VLYIHGYGHFQVDCPNQRTLFSIEIEEIQGLEEETSEEECKEEYHTVVTTDVGALLVIRRALHAEEVPLEPTQREQIFHTRCTIGDKVCGLSSTEVVAPMWLPWPSLTSNKSPPRCIQPFILFNGSSKEAR